MRRIVLSHSRVAGYFGCPSLYKFSHFFPQPDIRDISGDGTTNFPMDVGTALHIAMQDYMLNGDYNRAVFLIWKHFPFALYERGERDNGRTVYAALAAFNKFVEARPRDFYKLITVNGNPSNELIIEIKLGRIGELEFVYQMHIDFVLERLTDGLIIPADIKTYRGEDKLARYQYSLQLLPYMLGINMLLDRPEPLQFEGEYWFLGIALQEPVFKTLSVIKDHQHFQYWLQTVQQVARSIADNVHTGRWPRNDNHCISYGLPCRWADYCWTNATDAEHDDWFTSQAQGFMLRNDEKPAFSFDMEVL